MKKVVLIITICFAIFNSIKAQTTLDLSLYNKVQASSKNNSNQFIDVLVQGNIEQIKKAATSLGGTYKYACGDIASINMPMKQIGNLASQQGIMRMEAFAPNNHPLNDTMLKNNNVLPVHAGQSPLTQSYDGTGVVIGLIDTGIDFTHADFKDSLGHSRVKYLWDQTLGNSTNTPMPYNYGQEFSNTDIDNGLASASTDILYVGHGTHTAGIAASNGLAPGHFKGVAPKADIIMVAANFASSNNIIVDGVNYIYAKALAMNKPCVINISIGGSFGSHDGNDLQAQAINNLILAHNGRAVVAAAGNDGEPPYFHLGYTVTSDTNFTLFGNIHVSHQDSLNGFPNGYVDMIMYGSTANFANLKFSVGADQMVPTHSYRGKIPLRTTVAYTVGTPKWDTLKHNGQRIGRIESVVTLVSGTSGNGVYTAELLILPDSNAYDWRLITTGAGSFDLWAEFYVLVSPPLPLIGTMPDSAFYKVPDANKTISTSYQCLDNVITVGAYSNRRTLLDYDNAIFDDGDIVGAHASYSSLGPTRDGRIKPDISSPGSFLVSAMVPSLLNSYYLPIGANGYVSFDQQHVGASGTSAASPSVAGIVALYLQKNPTASVAMIKSAITSCATQDQFTGNTLPNNIWGYGKANAFTTLTGCSSVGIEEVNAVTNSMMVYPNPAVYGSSLNINISNYKATDKTELRIYNSIGQLVKNVTLVNSISSINNSLQAGVYYCNLIINGQKVSTQKLVIL